MKRYAFALVLLLSGCCGEGALFCRSDHVAFDCRFQNEGKGAICVFDGRYGPYCAFPDTGCGSGYRWGDDAYVSSCTCVDPALLQVDMGARRD